MHVRNLALIFILPFAFAQSLNSPGADPANAPGDWTYRCGGDVLVDDFSVDRTWNAPNGEFKHLSALDGDWKWVGPGSFRIDTNRRALVLTPRNSAGGGETENYFFTQFTSQRRHFDKACVNLTPFDALEFTASAPEGFDFLITFTQRATGDCEVRTADSTYRRFTDYYKTPGQEQRIRLPFSDFAGNTNGGTFDFAWTKDFTLVNLKGRNDGDSVIIKNFWLRGRPCRAGEQGPNGGGSPPTTTTTTTTAPPPPPPTTTTTPSTTTSTTTTPSSTSDSSSGSTSDSTSGSTSTSTVTQTTPTRPPPSGTDDDKTSDALPAKGGVIGLVLGLAGLALGAIGF